MSRSRKLQVMFAHAFYDSVMIVFVFLGFIFFSYGSGVGCHCEKVEPQCAINARGVAAGKMGRNSSMLLNTTARLRIHTITLPGTLREFFTTIHSVNVR